MSNTQENFLPLDLYFETSLSKQPEEGKMSQGGFRCGLGSLQSNDHIYELALGATRKLDRRTGPNGMYFSVQISTGDSSRIYIWLSSAMLNQYIVHEEYDGNSKLDTTMIKKWKELPSYIRSFDNITFIGKNEEEGKVEVIYDEVGK
jgi:hypothetical protein